MSVLDFGVILFLGGVLEKAGKYQRTVTRHAYMIGSRERAQEEIILYLVTAMVAGTVVAG